MDNTKNLSPAQRAAIFMNNTRQFKQTLPKQTTENENTTLQFTLPKARLLSRIMLKVTGTINLKGTEGTVNPSSTGVYNILRRVSLDLNNGFMPFVISGEALAMYNMACLYPEMYYGENKMLNNFTSLTCSTSGTDNNFEFLLDMPLTLNETSPVGIFLLQNGPTNVQLTVDINNAKSMFNNSDLKEGQTPTLKSITVTPILETFAVPSINDGMPDISVIKLVTSRNETISASGQHEIKLPIGTFYRKLFIYLTDTNGVPFTDDDITSNIELVFNQADTPYSIDSASLRLMNTFDYGAKLPKGMYAFDFSKQNIPNNNSNRDIIDTENLTEFWIRFNTGKAGNITVISEVLSRLSK